MDLDKQQLEELETLGAEEAVGEVLQKSTLLSAEEKQVILEQAQKHPEFWLSLLTVDAEHTAPGRDRRGYQVNAVKKITQDMLMGHFKGQLIMGTGAGKTTTIFNLIEQTKGRVLYIGPSKASVKRGILEIKTRETERSWTKLKGNGAFKNFDPTTDIHFATSQMMIYNGRFKTIDPDHYDLIVFDEAHHFFGEKVSELAEHFQGYQVHMTATRETLGNHLDDFVPHEFSKYTSEDLIKNDGFPSWVYLRYEVKDEDLDNVEVVGNRFILKDGKDGEVNGLKMPDRYKQAKAALKMALSRGEQAMCFMPSVASSKHFIENVVNKDPELAGKVLHVDGKSKDRDEIERRFKAGEIMAVCSNTLWSESFDHPPLSHVILVDPCLSPWILEQRIGRGARPHEGKTHLYIHDIVSAVANRRRNQLSVPAAMGMKEVANGMVLNGPKKGAVVDHPGEVQENIEYLEGDSVVAKKIHVAERLYNVDHTFLRDPAEGARLFESFAQHFGVAPLNLVMSPGSYFGRSEELEIKVPNRRSFSLTFKDAYDLADLYMSLERITMQLFENVEVGAGAIEEKPMETAKDYKASKDELEFLHLQQTLMHAKKAEISNAAGREISKCYLELFDKAIHAARVTGKLQQIIPHELNDEEAIAAFEGIKHLLPFEAAIHGSFIEVDFLIKSSNSTGMEEVAILNDEAILLRILEIRGQYPENLYPSSTEPNRAGSLMKRLCDEVAKFMKKGGKIDYSNIAIGCAFKNSFDKRQREFEKFGIKLIITSEERRHHYEVSADITELIQRLNPDDEHVEAEENGVDLDEVLTSMDTFLFRNHFHNIAKKIRKAIREKGDSLDLTRVDLGMMGKKIATAPKLEEEFGIKFTVVDGDAGKATLFADLSEFSDPETPHTLALALERVLARRVGKIGIDAIGGSKKKLDSRSAKIFRKIASEVEKQDSILGVKIEYTLFGSSISTFQRDCDKIGIEYAVLDRKPYVSKSEINSNIKGETFTLAFEFSEDIKSEVAEVFGANILPNAEKRIAETLGEAQLQYGIDDEVMEEFELVMQTAINKARRDGSLEVTFPVKDIYKGFAPLYAAVDGIGITNHWADSTKREREFMFGRFAKTEEEAETTVSNEELRAHITKLLHVDGPVKNSATCKMLTLAFDRAFGITRQPIDYTSFPVTLQGFTTKAFHIDMTALADVGIVFERLEGHAYKRECDVRGAIEYLEVAKLAGGEFPYAQLREFLDDRFGEYCESRNVPKSKLKYGFQAIAQLVSRAQTSGSLRADKSVKNFSSGFSDLMDALHPEYLTITREEGTRIAKMRMDFSPSFKHLKAVLTGQEMTPAVVEVLAEIAPTELRRRMTDEELDGFLSLSVEGEGSLTWTMLRNMIARASIDGGPELDLSKLKLSPSLLHNAPEFPKVVEAVKAYGVEISVDWDTEGDVKPVFADITGYIEKSVEEVETIGPAEVLTALKTLWFREFPRHRKHYEKLIRAVSNAGESFDPKRVHLKRMGKNDAHSADLEPKGVVLTASNEKKGYCDVTADISGFVANLPSLADERQSGVYGALESVLAERFWKFRRINMSKLTGERNHMYAVPFDDLKGILEKVRRRGSLEGISIEAGIYNDHFLAKYMKELSLMGISAKSHSRWPWTGPRGPLGHKHILGLDLSDLAADVKAAMGSAPEAVQNLEPLSDYDRVKRAVNDFFSEEFRANMDDHEKRMALGKTRSMVLRALMNMGANWVGQTHYTKHLDENALEMCKTLDSLPFTCSVADDSNHQKLKIDFSDLKENAPAVKEENISANKRWVMAKIRDLVKDENIKEQTRLTSQDREELRDVAERVIYAVKYAEEGADLRKLRLHDPYYFSHVYQWNLGKVGIHFSRNRESKEYMVNVESFFAEYEAERTGYSFPREQVKTKLIQKMKEWKQANGEKHFPGEGRCTLIDSLMSAVDSTHSPYITIREMMPRKVNEAAVAAFPSLGIPVEFIKYDGGGRYTCNFDLSGLLDADEKVEAVLAEAPVDELETTQKTLAPEQIREALQSLANEIVGDHPNDAVILYDISENFYEGTRIDPGNAGIHSWRKVSADNIEALQKYGVDITWAKEANEVGQHYFADISRFLEEQFKHGAVVLNETVADYDPYEMELQFPVHLNDNDARVSEFFRLLWEEVKDELKEKGEVYIKYTRLRFLRANSHCDADSYPLKSGFSRFAAALHMQGFNVETNRMEGTITHGRTLKITGFSPERKVIFDRLMSVDCEVIEDTRLRSFGKFWRYHILDKFFERPAAYQNGKFLYENHRLEEGPVTLRPSELSWLTNDSDIEKLQNHLKKYGIELTYRESDICMSFNPRSGSKSDFYPVRRKPGQDLTWEFTLEVLDEVPVQEEEKAPTYEDIRAVLETRLAVKRASLNQGETLPYEVVLWEAFEQMSDCSARVGVETWDERALAQMEKAFTKLGLKVERELGHLSFDFRPLIQEVRGAVPINGEQIEYISEEVEAAREFYGEKLRQLFVEYEVSEPSDSAKSALKKVYEKWNFAHRDRAMVLYAQLHDNPSPLGHDSLSESLGMRREDIRRVVNTMNTILEEPQQILKKEGRNSDLFYSLKPHPLAPEMTEAQAMFQEQLADYFEKYELEASDELRRILFEINSNYQSEGQKRVGVRPDAFVLSVLTKEGDVEATELPSKVHRAPNSIKGTITRLNKDLLVDQDFMIENYRTARQDRVRIALDPILHPEEYFDKYFKGIFKHYLHRVDRPNSETLILMKTVHMTLRRDHKTQTGDHIHGDATLYLCALLENSEGLSLEQIQSKYAVAPYKQTHALKNLNKYALPGLGMEVTETKSSNETVIYKLEPLTKA